MQRSMRTAIFLVANDMAQAYYKGAYDYRDEVSFEKYLAAVKMMNRNRITIQCMEDIRKRYNFRRDDSRRNLFGIAYLDMLQREPLKYDFTRFDKLVQAQLDSGAQSIYTGIAEYPTDNVIRLPRDERLIAEHVKLMQEHCRQKGWLDKAYFYLPDEPIRDDRPEHFKKVYQIVRKAAPDLKLLQVADWRKETIPLVGLGDIFASNGIHEVDDSEGVDMRTDGQRKWRHSGAELWFYTGCEPAQPFPNSFIEHTGIQPRLYGWLTWRYELKGFLYWGGMRGADYSKARWYGFKEGYELTAGYIYGNGDGRIFYPGPDMEIYPSLRVKYMRDGVEDYEYFAMLDRMLDDFKKNCVDIELINKVMNALACDSRVIWPYEPEGPVSRDNPKFAYTRDPNVFNQARKELGELIVKARSAAYGKCNAKEAKFTYPAKKKSSTAAF